MLQVNLRAREHAGFIRDGTEQQSGYILFIIAALEIYCAYVKGVYQAFLPSGVHVMPEDKARQKMAIMHTYILYMHF